MCVHSWLRRIVRSQYNAAEPVIWEYLNGRTSTDEAAQVLSEMDSGAVFASANEIVHRWPQLAARVSTLMERLRQVGEARGVQPIEGQKPPEEAEPELLV